MSTGVSMLLPARGRPDHLAASVGSLFALAKSPDEVEVLARLDDDDPDLEREVQVLSAHRNVRVFRGPRLGYAGMHEMYNRLAQIGRGEWLFLWNDDIEMLTGGWDALVREAPPYSVQFVRRDTTPTTDYTLPVLGRPLFEVLGHISKNAYCDAWISDVSGFAGTSVIRDDVVFRHHRLSDATMHGQSVSGPGEWAKFKTDEQRQWRRDDMEKIMASPLWLGRLDGWDCEFSEHVEVAHIDLASGERAAGAIRLRGRKALPKLADKIIEGAQPSQDQGSVQE